MLQHKNMTAHLLKNGKNITESLAANNNQEQTNRNPELAIIALSNDMIIKSFSLKYS